MFPKQSIARFSLLVILGVALCGWQSMEWKKIVDNKRSWLAMHEARMDEPAPDMRSVTGHLRLDPGRTMAMDLALTISAPAGAPGLTSP